MGKDRTEKDALGKIKVPSAAYYGSETERALGAYRISGIHMQKEFIMAYALVKRSAAFANMRTGRLDRKRGEAIVKACNEILKGKFDDQFRIDIFQAGAGTNINMNLNEVIANRAVEILGGKKGNYKIVHPNDHVNMSQSTNDTVPTTMRLSCYLATKELLKSLELLEKELAGKSDEFRNIIKTGRTHIQDAVPMKFGQEFGAYRAEVRQSINAISVVMPELLRVPIGGTAVGTGINADKKYRGFMIEELGKAFHAEIRPSKNVFADIQGRLIELDLSNSLIESAVALGKIANDFRLLASGPAGGISELILPEIQPGSSIMPGKINPSMPEMLNMVCFQVIGSGTVVREAASAGQLELNVFMPIMTYNLLFSVNILTNGVRAFAQKCVHGVKANRANIEEHLKGNLSIVTALTPYIGYGKSAEIAKIAFKKKKSIMDVCIEMKILDKKTLKRLLDPKKEI